MNGFISGLFSRKWVDLAHLKKTPRVHTKKWAISEKGCSKAMFFAHSYWFLAPYCGSIFYKFKIGIRWRFTFMRFQFTCLPYTIIIIIIIIIIIVIVIVIVIIIIIIINNIINIINIIIIIIIIIIPRYNFRLKWCQVGRSTN